MLPIITTLTELIKNNLKRGYTVVVKAISVSDNSADAFILGTNKTIHINLDTMIDDILDNDRSNCI